MARRATSATETDTEPEGTSTETETETEGAVDEGAVRQIVGEMLAALGITEGTSTETETETETEGATKPPARTQAAVEADVEGKVRAAIDNLRGEEDRDRRIAALEERTAEPERSPVKERVSTRVMGWSRKVSR